MWAYERGFAEFNMKVAQVLITKEDFSDRKRYINTKNTLLTLLSYGIIPIINENDTVSTDEIKFGDNDNLASLVAILVEADRLIILSDVEGLYSQDPRINAKAGLVRYVEEITPAIEKMAGRAGSSVGSGGMYTKVLAAGIATSHGIQVNIISGKKREFLLKQSRADSMEHYSDRLKAGFQKERDGLRTAPVPRERLSSTTARPER